LCVGRLVRDTSSAAHLKILGYMKNYDVSNGAVVYPVKIESRFVNVVEEEPGFVRSTPPGGGNFIAATVTPGGPFEAQNAISLEKLANFLLNEVLS